MLHEGMLAEAPSYSPLPLAVPPFEGFIDPAEKEAKHECGVFGVWAPGEDVGTVGYIAGILQEHRGVSASGMGYLDPDTNKFVVHKGLGRMMKAVPEMWPVNGGTPAEQVRAHVSVTHNRYSTHPDERSEDAHPYIVSVTGKPAGLLTVTNGNVDGTRELAEKRGVTVPDTGTDSLITTYLLADELSKRPEDIVGAYRDVLKDVRGAYCQISIYDGKLIAVKDPWDVHPLKVATYPDGKRAAIASEAIAFDGIQEELTVRDVQPGEMIIIDETGIQSVQLLEPQQSQKCIIESVYLASEREVTFGAHNATGRYNLGKKLAHVAPVEADYVVGVPSSGLPIAKGYADESGIEYKEIIVKNSLATRSFLLRGVARDKMLQTKFEFDQETLSKNVPPDVLKEINELAALAELTDDQHALLENLLAENIHGDTLIVVDDSFIKGNTVKAIDRILKLAGASRVHWRFGAMPFVSPCNQGVDAGNIAELVARGRTPDEVAAYLNVDSLAFNTFEDVEAAFDEARVDPSSASLIGQFCRGCAKGEYVISEPATVTAERSRKPVLLGMPAIGEKAMTAAGMNIHSA